MAESSGVRTEHDLRRALETSERRRLQLERIVAEARWYLESRRAKDDLARLRRAIEAAGPPRL